MKTRIVSTLLALIFAGFVVTTTSGSAVACTSSGGTNVGSGNDAFNAGVNQGSTCSSDDQSVSSPSTLDGTWHQETFCSSGACAGCNDNPGVPLVHIWFVTSDGVTTYDWTGCPESGSLAPPQVTESIVANAFRRIPLPASPLNIQPPGGKTLVNFDTNFYTEQQSLDRTVRLLGQRVDLHITVAAYTWRFDDGQKLRTSKPGAPYPHLQITHNYLQKGGYAPSLDTTYVADYRVNGGAWHTVPGSVTIEGDPERLTAVEARPVLVGYTG